MYEPNSPDEYNFKQVDSQNKVVESDNLIERSQAENLSVRNVAQHQQQIKRLFLWLIGIGLGLGVIVAIGVGIFLHKFGLATKPDEKDTQPQQEQVEDRYLEDLEGVERQ